MLYFNGIDLDNIIFNNVELNTIEFNNVVVWRRDLYLYNYGDECTNITGGWGTVTRQNAILPSGGGWNDEPWMMRNGDSFEMFIDHDPINRIGLFYTINKIDLSKYNKLCFEYTVSFEDTNYTGNLPRYAVFRAGNDLYLQSSNIICNYTHYNTNGNVDKKIIEIDISQIIGQYYVQFFLARDGLLSSAKMDLKVYKIYLSM